LHRHCFHDKFCAPQQCGCLPPRPRGERPELVRCDPWRCGTPRMERPMFRHRSMRPPDLPPGHLLPIDTAPPVVADPRFHRAGRRTSGVLGATVPGDAARRPRLRLAGCVASPRVDGGRPGCRRGLDPDPELCPGVVPWPPTIQASPIATIAAPLEAQCRREEPDGQPVAAALPAERVRPGLPPVPDAGSRGSAAGGGRQQLPAGGAEAHARAARRPDRWKPAGASLPSSTTFRESIA
jgi:hypothetical protein